LDKMKPFFEKELEARGFKVILWSPGGWLYYFSRRPIIVPDDLRRQKLWVWGNPDEVQAWQRSGFQVVPLSATDILTSLQSGMIDAVISSPLLTASNQWFGITSNMSDLKLAPLWGAVVVGAKSWAQVPRDLQPILLKAAQRIADQLSTDIEKSDDQAISEMKKYGLQIIHVDAASREIWEKTVQDGFGMLLGTAYDAKAYEMAKGYLGQYRTAKKKRSGVARAMAALEARVHLTVIGDVDPRDSILILAELRRDRGGTPSAVLREQTRPDGMD
jgi:TRAP-type C4-dicarboxylate transport system substrate-binding protein